MTSPSPLSRSRLSVAPPPSADPAAAPWWRLLRPEDAYILLYMALTALIVVFAWRRFETPWLHLISRAGAMAFILLFVPFAQRVRNDWTSLVRDMYYMLMFIFLYTETAALHHGLWDGRSFDKFIAPLDEWLFGYQPAIAFMRAMDQRWFSELMNFCYTFYYLLFCLGGLVMWLRKDNGIAYGRMLHAVVLSMLLCYVVFVVFPTVGPQYRFADLYDRDNMSGYIWKYVLDSILEFGERPTGAIPSSHVALATVFMLAFWNYARTAFWISLPMVAGLFVSTVYIGVHYFVDVPAGFLAGALGWYASEPVRAFVARKTGLTPLSPRTAPDEDNTRTREE